MRIVGIDPGSFVIAMGLRSGKKKGQGLEYAVAEPQDPKLRRKGSRALTRFLPLITEFAIVIRRLNPTYCYVEEPIYAGSFPATMALGMISGGIAVELDRLDMPFSFVGNGTWKRALLGNGKASKDEIRTWVLARFPGLDDGLIQDVYDAIAIAEWGNQAFGRRR